MRTAKRPAVTMPGDEMANRLSAIDWHQVAGDLDTRGCALVSQLLAPGECAAVAAMYPDDGIFRSRVLMQRHGFGRGEYKYFSYPLPGLITGLRTFAYPYLATVANRWNAAMAIDVRYPEQHPRFIEHCHAAGQTRPTCLLLHYGTDDYNCLHQDLYGAQVFPLQMAILLSDAERDFTGGEFILTEQRPRTQSRAEVVPLRRGDAVIFAVHQRPMTGLRGTYRVKHRHGVGRVRSGHRHTLGIIFHDAL